MPEPTDKIDWLTEHEWLVHELLHETRKLARCRGRVDAATQRGQRLGHGLVERACALEQVADVCLIGNGRKVGNVNSQIVSRLNSEL